MLLEAGRVDKCKLIFKSCQNAKVAKWKHRQIYVRGVSKQWNAKQEGREESRWPKRGKTDSYNDCRKLHAESICKRYERAIDLDFHVLSAII